MHAQLGSPKSTANNTLGHLTYATGISLSLQKQVEKPRYCFVQYIELENLNGPNGAAFDRLSTVGQMIFAEIGNFLIFRTATVCLSSALTACVKHSSCESQTIRRRKYVPDPGKIVIAGGMKLTEAVDGTPTLKTVEVIDIQSTSNNCYDLQPIPIAFKSKFYVKYFPHMDNN